MTILSILLITLIMHWKMPIESYAIFGIVLVGFCLDLAYLSAILSKGKKK